jgi:hypothetical protein
MYIDVNLIIFEHKLSPQPIPFRLLGRPTRGKGGRPSGPVRLASPLFGTEMPEPDARAPDRDSVSPEGVVGKLNRAYSAVSSPCVSRKIFKRHTSELKKPTVSSEKEIRQCLVSSKFQKFYKILCHIKSLDACMEH